MLAGAGQRSAELYFGGVSRKRTLLSIIAGRTGRGIDPVAVTVVQVHHPDTWC